MYPNAIICMHLGVGERQCKQFGKLGTSRAPMLLFARMQGGVKICLAASVRGVCANSIIGKHLGRLGVTKEHIMCANAIICTQLGQAEPIMSANAIICTHLGGLASGSAGSSGNWVSPKSTSCAQMLLFARKQVGGENLASSGRWEGCTQRVLFASS